MCPRIGAQKENGGQSGYTGLLQIISFLFHLTMSALVSVVERISPYAIIAAVSVLVSPRLNAVQNPCQIR